MTKKYDESVLVVPADLTQLNDVMNYLHGTRQFVDRNIVETDESVRQVIPYVVVMNRKLELFTYKRLAGDSRLVEKYSIGVGGHANFVGMWQLRRPESLEYETETDKCLKIEAARELEEELGIGRMPGQSFPWDSEDFLAGPYGIIRLSNNPVNRVHLGLVYLLTVNFDVKVRETESLEGSFMRPEDLGKSPVYDKLEDWSKEALEILSVK